MAFHYIKDLLENGKELKITVVGMGYIGLPTATLFASAGYKVMGYDIDEHTINTLESGKITIVEPGLQELFSTVISKGALKPTNILEPSDLFIICVPTPFSTTDGERKADLSYVRHASEEIGRVLKRGNIVVLESTVPPGTTSHIVAPILEKTSGLTQEADFFTAHCPERVLPGKMLYELRHNDRIIGSDDEETGNILKEIYSSIVTDGHIYLTDDKTAELCKLVENTYRDVNIAFANELSMICDKLGIDVWKLIRLANKHPRVNIMRPGPGVGGHCLAVDPWFIVEQVPELAKVIRTCRETNEYKTQWITEKIDERIHSELGDRKGIKVGILGLAYKPNIDDLRESPALHIASSLCGKGYKVLACEPNIAQDRKFEGIDLVDLTDLVERSDFVVYAVAHTKFAYALPFIGGKPIFDAVGVL